MLTEWKCVCYSNAALLSCSLSEGRSRPRKELGLKAPLRAMTVIACVCVREYV